MDNTTMKTVPILEAFTIGLLFIAANHKYPHVLGFLRKTKTHAHHAKLIVLLIKQTILNTW
jgi:hypothetical protein